MANATSNSANVAGVDYGNGHRSKVALDASNSPSPCETHLRDCPSLAAVT